MPLSRIVVRDRYAVESVSVSFAGIIDKEVVDPVNGVLCLGFG